MKDVIIQTQALTKVYDDVIALQNLDLTVHENSIFGFLGPNGAGKTTTMKLLLGLAKPTRGSGAIFGMDIVEESNDIRARVGYLPQDPRFFEHMTARETLDFTVRFFFQGPEEAIEARVAEMLDLVGLEEKADRPIKGFSGGERQRLGIAQAQVNYPDLLILDEPAAALDPLGRRDVLEVMERLRKHTTIFYSTHILDDVQKVSDTVTILNHGELAAQGAIETLLAGSGGAAYSVVIKAGDVQAALARVRREPWVAEIQVEPEPAATRWTVNVTDPDAAEARLMRRLLEDPEMVVAEFRRRAYELEEIFVNLVEGEGGDHDGQ
ncbi:MAG: ATP-binding cassette domain-containing protein [Chloroflexi bacterium]|jgi:ABC-2 type transport system ATP-binding protein|nr:ATP-binding cassette domain-containing protein [Chloroflexota bacterium]